MKKLLLVAAMLISAPAFSQGLLNNIKKEASPATMPSIGNINDATKGIMDKLSPALSLSNMQVPKVTAAITDFLKKKASIMPLLNTDKAAYLSKFSGLQSGLFSKLKGVLTATQYTKFLGLKPKAPSAANVLSNLFF